MRQSETIEGIVSLAQQDHQAASARGQYLQAVPQIYPHLASANPELADFITHSFAWMYVILCHPAQTSRPLSRSTQDLLHVSHP